MILMREESGCRHRVQHPEMKCVCVPVERQAPPSSHGCRERLENAGAMSPFHLQEPAKVCQLWLVPEHRLPNTSKPKSIMHNFNTQKQDVLCKARQTVHICSICTIYVRLGVLIIFAQSTNNPGFSLWALVAVSFTTLQLGSERAQALSVFSVYCTSDLEHGAAMCLRISVFGACAGLLGFVAS